MAKDEKSRISLPKPLLANGHELEMDASGIAADIRRHFNHTLGCDKHSVSDHHVYEALVIALRDRLMELWKSTHYSYQAQKCKRTQYLSLEFLMGRSLGNTLLNLGIREEVDKAVSDLGFKLEDVIEVERDAGLGNGGLGRLAACFLDSCATLQLPVMGHCIRYEYGIFRQRIEDGEQVEQPDHWLACGNPLDNRLACDNPASPAATHGENHPGEQPGHRLTCGNPWELERTEFIQRIKFRGRVQFDQNGDQDFQVRWVDTDDVLAVPYDIPIPGYRNGTVNTLRVWKAVAVEEFDLAQFNAGNYVEAVSGRLQAENISKVLYPNDASENGKELRLRQQYFLTSAALQDVMRRWLRDKGEDFSSFAEKNCFQLNDTHPAVAVAELMRLLMDVRCMGWDQAWVITTRCMAYTNHTLLPEALERWPVRTFRDLLPRVLDIIFEINARFLSQVASRWPGDTDRQARMSIIEEGVDPQVRMAHLAIVGSFSVNGVAALHTKLLEEGLFKDFYELWPEKFNNKTNGVTPRRFLALANPSLSALITETLGEGWETDLARLKDLRSKAEDKAFRQRWQEIKLRNKIRFAKMVESCCGIRCNPDALFDVQVKRIHEYKRQLLNVLHVIHLYDRIKRGDTNDWTPRCVFIGGKAAPGYWIAKRIIKFVNNVAKVVNEDPAVGNLLKVAFLPNYRVSAMEIIAPGTDLSSQISTAGKEASGTGNMKFMMNGAITIGTLDGANVEILEEVREENFFLFGLTEVEVAAKRKAYDPERIIREDEDLSRVMQLIDSSHFNQFEPGIFDAIIGSMRSPSDPWMAAADFRGFIDAQKRAAEAFRDQDRWIRMSIVNTACCARFSSDRTITDYNREIWKLEPVAPEASDQSA